MKKEEIIEKYGKSRAKKIFNKLRGQTVAVAEDGSHDFYEYDVTQANNELESSEEPDDFD
jgi:hypothetical protein